MGRDLYHLLHNRYNINLTNIMLTLADGNRKETNVITSEVPIAIKNKSALKNCIIGQCTYSSAS